MTAQLRGEAKQWCSLFASTVLSFEDFENRFLKKFNSRQLLAKLRSKVYTRQQRENQPTATFVGEQFALARRVFPEASDVDIIDMIFYNTPGDVRLHLKNEIYDTAEEFVNVAMEVEEDLEDVRHFMGGPDVATLDDVTPNVEKSNLVETWGVGTEGRWSWSTRA